MDPKEFNALLNKFNDIRKVWADVYGRILTYRIAREFSKIKKEGNKFLNTYAGIFNKVGAEIAKTELGIALLNDKEDAESRKELNRLKLQLALLKKMWGDKDTYFNQLASYLK